MDLILAIVLIVLAFLGGALGGMYLVRKQIEKEFADNPRLYAEAVPTVNFRMLYLQDFSQ